jgi:class 3 adenylate cyclase
MDGDAHISRSRRQHDLALAQREFLKYAPAYAQAEASAAIEKVVDLQAQGVIRDGLYYIVLVDLVGSTTFAADFGNDALGGRIKLFIRSSFNALTDIRIRNVGLFVREIGDAVLYLFQHFPDLLRWRAQLDRWLSIPGFNQPAYVLRTCVHIGEVYLDGVNPLSLAVSQVFKMEKSVPDGALALSAPAYSVAWPTLARAYRLFEQLPGVTLPGFSDPVPLYKLKANDPAELENMAAESIS